jgi:hypothetical protein
MFERIHQKLGTAGFIISIVALVAALGGGAYAATGGNSGKATASAKAKQGKQGKQGKPGKTGPQGPAGPAGAPGANGKDGAEGKQGPEGKAGKDGTGVTGVAIPTSSATCAHQGGTAYTSATGTENVCNGKEGTAGEPGVLHPGETLPSEATETGTWWFQGTGGPVGVAPISFAIPLTKTDAEEIAIKFWTEGGSEPAECTGDTLEPAAEPGTLCIYAGPESEFNTLPIGHPQVLLPGGEERGEAEEGEGTGTSGVLLFLRELSNEKFKGGSFAVTAR